jgi:nucleotide-binding universal stress UspA family protein
MAGIVHGVLVGFDGSPGSEEAVGWGVKEALARGELLTVCHAWTPGYLLPTTNMDVPEYAEREAERVLAAGTLLAQTLARTDAAWQGEVRALLVAGAAAEALREQSGRARMLVVGRRGHGGLPGLLLGSVSSQAAAYAQAPVVVVRGQWRRPPDRLPAPIVAGIDGSAAAEPAVEFAFCEAAAHGAPLIAVCAMSDSPQTPAAHQIAGDCERQLDRWEKAYPAVVVRRHINAGSARTALLEAARDTSQLVVVGARGRGGIRGMMLGSVTQALLNHAPCPVAVVHGGGVRSMPVVGTHAGWSDSHSRPLLRWSAHN